MKKSEMLEILDNSRHLGDQEVVDEMEARGVTWDPEEPEVLWIDPAPHPLYRILGSGECQVNSLFGISGETREWKTHEGPHPAMTELARRLLAGRAAADKLMQHNLLAGLAGDKNHVTDGSPCWCNPVTDKPEGDQEAPPNGRRLARIVKCGNPTWWYAGHVGKIFEVAAIVPGEILVYQPNKGMEFIVEPEDVEMLEFLDIKS